MKLLCETNHKIIYIDNDNKNVRILHSHSMDFQRHYYGDTETRRYYCESMISSYKLAEGKLSIGRLISQGQFEQILENYQLMAHESKEQIIFLEEKLG